ncbi:hypothetical protein AtEden1_Chr1g0028721 [Arabidopsis thaliana]
MLRLCPCSIRFGPQENILKCLFCFFEQFIFPKFLLVSGMDDQDLSVLQGFTSWLIVPFAFVVEFVTFGVTMNAIKQEVVKLVLVCRSLMCSFFDLYLIYHSFNHLLVTFFGNCCLFSLYFLCYGCIFFSCIRGCCDSLI